MRDQLRSQGVGEQGQQQLIGSRAGLISKFIFHTKITYHIVDLTIT